MVHAAVYFSKVNAFEEDNTVKLQIAAHVGARQNVEKNFREACLRSEMQRAA